MRPRATHLLLLLDYGIGMFFALSILAVGTLGFALTGMPKSYEVQALGSVYTEFLARVESGAHDLRSDYCANADLVARLQASCPPQFASIDATTA